MSVTSQNFVTWTQVQRMRQHRTRGKGTEFLVADVENEPLSLEQYCFVVIVNIMTLIFFQYENKYINFKEKVT